MEYGVGTFQLGSASVPGGLLRVARHPLHVGHFCQLVPVSIFRSYDSPRSLNRNPNSGCQARVQQIDGLGSKLWQK